MEISLHMGKDIASMAMALHVQSRTLAARQNRGGESHPPMRMGV